MVSRFECKSTDTPYERRVINLQHLDLVGRVYDLENQLFNANAAIESAKGRPRLLDQHLGLVDALRHRQRVMAALAEARAREQTLARQLERPRDQFADVREREVVALASFEMMERMAS